MLAATGGVHFQMDLMTNIIFIVASFALGWIVLAKRDTLAPNLRRGLALASIVLIAFSFFLIVFSLFQMGSS